MDRSPGLILLHLFVAVVALWALWFGGQYHLALQTALTLVVLISTVDSLSRSAFRVHPDAVCGLSLSQNEWSLQRVGGDWLRAELLPGIYLSAWCIVARFKHAHGVERVVLARDDIAADEFRQIYVRLRFN